MSDQQNNPFEDKSIEEVLELIENGDLTPAQALEIEIEGKNRKTLIATLEKMLESSQEEKQADMVKGVIIKNVKHNTTRYQIGQKEEFSKEDFEILLATKAIRPLEE